MSLIKPTLGITRIPRSLDDIVHWKASEFRNFLLYWGIPTLKGILSTNYLLYFACLAKAIFILSLDTIQPNDLIVAETLLFEFVKGFEDLYSLRYMTINVHQLVHLADSVRRTGPLFAKNCSIFEDLNGFIVSHLHGTQSIESQVIKTINLIQAIPVLQEKFGGIDTEVDYFLDVLRGTARSSWNILQSGVYQIGQFTIRTITKN